MKSTTHTGSVFQPKSRHAEGAATPLATHQELEVQPHAMPGYDPQLRITGQ